MNDNTYNNDIVIEEENYKENYTFQQNIRDMIIIPSIWISTSIVATKLQKPDILKYAIAGTGIITCIRFLDYLSFKVSVLYK